jgi:hypothetical protein
MKIKVLFQWKNQQFEKNLVRIDSNKDFKVIRPEFKLSLLLFSSRSFIGSITSITTIDTVNMIKIEPTIIIRQEYVKNINKLVTYKIF